MKMGLIFTDPKVRSVIGDRLKDRANSLSDTISDRYDEAFDRVEAAGDALQGKSVWPSRMVALFLGIGIGTGIGMVFAPKAGSDTRQAIRDRAVDMKNKAVHSASSATERVRSSVTNMPSTGTHGG
jgi:hypothetical protein